MNRSKRKEFEKRIKDIKKIFAIVIKKTITTERQYTYALGTIASVDFMLSKHAELKELIYDDLVTFKNYVESIDKKSLIPQEKYKVIPLDGDDINETGETKSYGRVTHTRIIEIEKNN